MAKYCKAKCRAKKTPPARTRRCPALKASKQMAYWEKPTRISPFFYFLNQFRQKVLNHNPNQFKSREVTELAGCAWHFLSSIDKDRYRLESYKNYYLKLDFLEKLEQLYRRLSRKDVPSYIN